MQGHNPVETIVVIRDWIMPVVGLLGIGGGAVALYFRATLAETIINRLNGRYVNTNVYQTNNVRMDDRLARLEDRLCTLEAKVDHGFENLRAQVAHGFSKE